VNRFDQKLAEHQLTLRRARLQTLQVNVGRKCNQACRHCHVDAAPWRTEMIDEPTAHRVGAWIQKHRPEIVDITGGAPELSEFFRYFVETARACGAHVIDRNNLTIIEEENFGWLPQYLAKHEVEVIASLPCYSAKNVNQQRGNGVFDKSISALKKLNAVGYGGRLLPSFPAWLIDGRRPSRLAWLLKERMLPGVYWKAMLRGREWLAQPELTA